MYWSYFWALFALCFHYEIFLDSFGWKKVADYVTSAQAALLIKLLHGIFKIANMAKILYENIKRKLTIVSYRPLALTMPNLVVLYHTPRPQHCDQFHFLSFLSDHFVKPKAEKYKIPFLVTKSGEKFNLIWFSEPRPQNCGWFHLLFFLHDHFIKPKAEKHKIPFLVTKSG